MAFFEALRTEGFRAFEAVCVHARSLGIPVIIDGKRGDIGTTAAAYARAYLEATEKGPPLGDALTVNAWLGSDGVLPFLDAARPHGGGIFVLVKTSNPSSCEVQDLECEGTPLYEHMATLVRSWNTPIGASGYGPVGAVVGATWPDHLVWLRKLLPGSILLLPGYGAQGAGPEDVVGGFDDEGVGALVSASRSLTFPWATDGAAPRDWEGRVLTVVNEMRRDLARVLGGSG
jgi:orotidine-5'-phosphate decarboxylase